MCIAYYTSETKTNVNVITIEREILMIENAYKIKERKTGKIYSCLPQMVDINHNGNYCLRYNVGINGYNA